MKSDATHWVGHPIPPPDRAFQFAVGSVTPLHVG
jgi:hypothetical protein